jgi:hypothetical protein
MKEGDVVIVNGKAGLIYEIEPDGGYWINMGGIICRFPKTTTIKLPPEELKEVLGLKIKQDDADFRERMSQATAPLAGVLEEYQRNRSMRRWLYQKIKMLIP